MTATTTASPEAIVRSCRRPGSGTSMPSRVVKTGRRSPIGASAIRRFTVSHTAAIANAMVNSVALRPQHGEEHLLVADLAEPQPVGVEAEQ